ncbi:hypothetical protein [Gelidibacter japonicus]|uniref:hypothetical protein n=1 Tax=Gelidibacter japonicus TaxID=1962232 RepID=UPI003A90D120
MIDINKFEKLANEIIASSTKNELQNWLESYRTNTATFVNFRTIGASFKMEFSNLKFSDNDSDMSSNDIRYSIAA